MSRGTLLRRMGPRTVRLAPSEIAIIGYGSLFSALSIGKTLGREYGGPFVIGHLGGWRRSWNVGMPNRAFYYEDSGQRVYPDKIRYLNVRREPESKMNCVVLAIRKDDLQAMDDREWIYDRTIVTDDLRGVTVKGGEAVMYVARPEFLVDGTTSRRDAAIRASYLRIVDAALDTLPYEVREEFDQSTDPMPRDLVIEDKLDPYRPNPWTAAGRRPFPERHTA